MQQILTGLVEALPQYPSICSPSLDVWMVEGEIIIISSIITLHSSHDLLSTYHHHDKRKNIHCMYYI